MKTVTSVEAQNRFGELLDNAQREPDLDHPAWAPGGVYRFQRGVSHPDGSSLAESAQTSAYLDAIAKFRGSGKKGGNQGAARSTSKADRQRER